MLFNSWQFLLVFLPVVLGVFLCLPAAWPNARKGWLIVVSFVFYAYWKIEYVPLLLASMGFNFGAAEGIIRWHGQRRGKLLFFAGVTGNLVLLGYYKYTNFFLQLFGRIADQPVPKFDLILPLAISFFTFTQIGYLVDVHRDKTKHYGLIDYSLFVVFFPHLIAGPIVRHWEIIPQFMRNWPRPGGKDLAAGIALFLIGLFKKVLIADPLSEYANAAFSALQPGLTLTFFDAWFGTLAYALQIYFDFSGYSDMAIGLARLFAIKFPFNFDSPYKARSVVEFWQRWHVTLSRFLREYLYFSLGGNRCGPLRQKFNVMTSMVLSGLWHGAGLPFVIWGALHGVYLVVAHVWQGLARRMESWQRHPMGGIAGWALTFLAVLLAWVLFRAPDLPSASRMFHIMAGAEGFQAPKAIREVKFGVGELFLRILEPTENRLHLSSYQLLVRMVIVMLLAVLFLPNSQQLLQAYDPTIETVARPSPIRLPLNGWTAFAAGILFFWVIRSWFSVSQSPFLYFNF